MHSLASLFGQMLNYMLTQISQSQLLNVFNQAFVFLRHAFVESKPANCQPRCVISSYYLLWPVGEPAHAQPGKFDRF